MIKLNNLRNQERDTMRTALTVLSSLAATRAELIEAEQERLSEVIADAVKQEDALDEVHQALEQALRARGINTAGPTKELVTRLAESGASMRRMLEDGLAGARAELEAERARHEATRSELECLRRARAELEAERARHEATRSELECLRRAIDESALFKELDELRRAQTEARYTIDRLEREHANHLEVAHECYLQSLRDQLAAKTQIPKGESA